MESGYLIAIDDFCASHNIEISFISSLEQTGLIEITTINQAGYIDAGILQQLEKYIRFYYELDINLEGIETISHMLQRLDSLQVEIVGLRNRLLLYETNE